MNEVLATHEISSRIINYGLPDRLIQHGTREDMLSDAGLTKEGLLKFIRQHLPLSGHASKAKSA